MKKLRNSADIEDDIMEMRAEEQAQMAEAKITLFELVTSPTLKLPLLIAIIMQLSQQLSGINAVSTYLLGEKTDYDNFFLIKFRYSTTRPTFSSLLG